MIQRRHGARVALSSWHWTHSFPPGGVHLFVTVHIRPKADTDSAAIIKMIQKLQSADAPGAFIGDFNHLNFQKVLEQFVLACHSPCMPLWCTPGIYYAVRGTYAAGVPVGTSDHGTGHLLRTYSMSTVWTNDCSLTFQGCFVHVSHQCLCFRSQRTLYLSHK